MDGQDPSGPCGIVVEPVDDSLAVGSSNRGVSVSSACQRLASRPNPSAAAARTAALSCDRCDRDWGFDVEVDLEASDEEGTAVLRVVDAGRMD